MPHTIVDNRVFCICPHCDGQFVSMRALQIHCLMTSDAKHHPSVGCENIEAVSKSTDTLDVGVTAVTHEVVVTCVKCRRLIPKVKALLFNYRYECKSIIECLEHRGHGTTALVHVPRDGVHQAQQVRPKSPTPEETEAIRQELKQSCADSRNPST